MSDTKAETPMVVCANFFHPGNGKTAHARRERAGNAYDAHVDFVTDAGCLNPRPASRPADATYTTKAINSAGADFTLVNGEPLPADKAAKISAGIGPQTFTPSPPEGALPVEVTAYRGVAQGVADAPARYPGEVIWPDPAKQADELARLRAENAALTEKLASAEKKT